MAQCVRPHNAANNRNEAVPAAEWLDRRPPRASGLFLHLLRALFRSRATVRARDALRQLFAALR